MLNHRHFIRHFVALALLLGLAGAAPATARHQSHARNDMVQLAAGLEAATDEVRRELRGAYWGRRGGDASLERELAELQWQANTFRRQVARTAPRSRAARSELSVLLRRFYDADREIRRTAVPGHARNEFERARYFMDTLIARNGGYEHFRHVRPSGHGDRHDHRQDRRRRAYPRWHH